MNLEEFGLACTDAVPVYLSASTGKVFVPWDALDRRSQRRLQQLNGESPEHPLRSLCVDAVGSSRLNKDRLTWINRLCATKVWAPNSLPEGRVLDSILLVMGVHARLEDIDVEKKVWNKDVAFTFKDVVTVRKKVPALEE